MQLKIRFSDHFIGFVSLLELLFVGLKITFLIDWHWVWVLAPLWGSVVLFLLLSAFNIVRRAMFSFRTLPKKEE